MKNIYAIANRETKVRVTDSEWFLTEDEAHEGDVILFHELSGEYKMIPYEETISVTDALRARFNPRA